MVSANYLMSILGVLGQGGTPGELPNGVVVGPFNFACDLGTSIAADTSVTDLRLAASIQDPQLDQLGGTSDAGDFTLFATGARLILGGANADALDPGDLAQLMASLYLRHEQGQRTNWHPLASGIGLARVQSQRTQATGADGSFGGTHFPKVKPMTPVARVNFRSDPFSLHGYAAVATFAGSADLDECRLQLYGAAVKNSLIDKVSDPCDQRLTPGQAAKRVGLPMPVSVAV